MASGIRSETVATASLANVYMWLARNRGGQVDISDLCADHPSCGALLGLGLPIAAARAVICTMWMLEKEGSESPLLVGRFCALINPHDGSVTLVFDGSVRERPFRGMAPTNRERVRSEGIGHARHLLELIAVACARVDDERLIA